ncbi:MAG: hypothetical protein A2808_03860 [Candidatus Moranbacteria bacterium RIFCSPHIGHO2_01_FULL_55_24]|nr:MAG: hypothetical protein A2808_03860 [Candidatus Moranbacteria bacterium RIFCSPHIGHO2_01_FULL_55_24]
MNAFEEEEEASALLPPKAATCLCPSLLQYSSETLGVSCQKIFERAYKRSGQDDSYGRAMFVRFCNARQEEREDLIPSAIREYCERAEKMSLGRKPRRKGFCVGCRMNPKAWGGVVFCYALMYPEVTDALLQAEARGKHLNGNGKQAPEPELSEVDKLLLDLEDSGALDDFEDDSWDRNMHDDSFGT